MENHTRSSAVHGKSHTPNAPKFICPNCLPKPKSLWFWWKKASVVREQTDISSSFRKSKSRSRSRQMLLFTNSLPFDFWESIQGHGKIPLLIGIMVFCCQNCSDLQWEKIVLVNEKTFWNSRPKAKNLQIFWYHLNNFFEQWMVRTIFGNRTLF